MPGSENRTVTGWRKVSRFYRRPPGAGWLLALATIPLLLALIGYGLPGGGKLDVSAPDVSAPSVSAPSVKLPALAFAPLSILRNGNVVTLNGDVPDIAARTGLLDMLKGVFGGGVSLIDNLVIKPGVPRPDLSGLGSVFKAAVSLPDFKFKIADDTVTLMGTAASNAIKAAIESAAKVAWPNLKLLNNIEVSTDKGQAPGPSGTPAPGSTPTPAPAPTPSSTPSPTPVPSATAPAPAPAPSPAGDCANLQAEITAVMSAPVRFVTNGYTLTAGTKAQLAKVAEKVKGCHSAHLAVNGYTDNTGNDGINVPLSAARAKSVADFLVSHGVPAGSVTSKGFGSADPVASNATPDGRAQNRRVAITVS
ncbi:hypothetical protein BST33_13705 [Mycolicibacter minnesotensis]|uniref:Uncharacterized protein n=1 Tax=Mycolicibacter minnesotensis TaxID=1118379 RepID=A0A7I7R8E0_9MYCO|nr:OmpA family protein [Mycolicibacter minnesotensis]ORA99531.1 hypothetical protein BST33_13705 [Mycolicibacter minnesotensis]BBY34366.1 peptidoglycan-binding protein ArfA [Mycolicibacter minnesotensis]